MKSESPNEQKERWLRHQAMLRQHAMDKAEARERHRKHWHRIRIIPIQLI